MTRLGLVPLLTIRLWYIRHTNVQTIHNWTYIIYRTERVINKRTRDTSNMRWTH